MKSRLILVLSLLSLMSFNSLMAQTPVENQKLKEDNKQIKEDNKQIKEDKIKLQQDKKEKKEDLKHLRHNKRKNKSHFRDMVYFN